MLEKMDAAVQENPLPLTKHAASVIEPRRSWVARLKRAMTDMGLKARSFKTRREKEPRQATLEVTNQPETLF
jgi:hypothetical protein